MLQFFRKHQKFFFIVVTFFVVVSFAFFGAFKSYVPSAEVKERVVAKAIDGSKITDRTLAAIARTLTSDTAKAGMPNLLHAEGVEVLFLEPALADLIAKTYFPLMKEELQERLQRVKSYVPYSHPQAPFINALDVWKSLSPKIDEAIRQLQMEPEATASSFSKLATIYLEQKRLPQNLIKKMLSMQEQQYSWITPDPSLQQRNIALFGFETLRDWFGPTFIDCLSQCIVSGAIVAAKEGVAVSEKEARADLLCNVISGAKTHFNQEVTLLDAAAYLKREAQLLGLDEKSLIRGWQKVLSFKRYLDGIGEAIFQDPLVQQTFASFAEECVKVELYELPQELKLVSFDDLLSFQVYLEKTAAKSPLSLELPEALKSAEEVEKGCPELVSEQFYLKIQSLDLQELAQAIPLKEMWAWQARGENWSALVQEFEGLRGKEGAGALEGFNGKERQAIDAWSRLQMVRQDAASIQKALKEASAKTEWVRLSLKGEAPFVGIDAPGELLSKLRSSSLLEGYTQDGVHIYTFEVVKRGEGKELLSFAKARTDASFKRVVEKTLEEAYAKIRLRDVKRFEQSPGQWKPFQEVKDLVGAYLYAPLLRAIEKEENFSKEKITYSFYAKHRFSSFMRSEREAMLQGKAVQAPWRLVHQEVELTRRCARSLPVDELLAIEDGTWTEVIYGESSAPLFARILAHPSGAASGAQLIGAAGKKALADEARRAAFGDFLASLAEKKVIQPLKLVEEEF